MREVIINYISLLFYDISIFNRPIDVYNYCCLFENNVSRYRGQVWVIFERTSWLYCINAEKTNTPINLFNIIYKFNKVLL